MAITLKCKRGPGNREAPSINDPMIVSNSMARSRGKRFLDDNYYTAMKRTLKIPHKSNTIIPETWITVSNSHLGLSNQKLKVKDYKLTITKKSVWAIANVHQYGERTTS